MLKTYPCSKQNNFFKTFFPSSVTEWNSLGHNIRNLGSFSVFKNNILKFIRPTPNSVFNCENYGGIKHSTRMCFGLSHLHGPKFSFQNILNPICSCGFDVESTSHYVLHCPMDNDEIHTHQYKKTSIVDFYMWLKRS